MRPSGAFGLQVMLPSGGICYGICYGIYYGDWDPR